MNYIHLKLEIWIDFVQKTLTLPRFPEICIRQLIIEIF